MCIVYCSIVFYLLIILLYDALLIFYIASNYTVPVRLVDGNSSLDGRVEILKGGVWGTICDYYFSLLEGSVICRQLGYYGASATYGYAFYPSATNNTPIATSYVFCYGDEVQFGDCYGVQQSWSTQYCTHQDDVGVVCLGEELM